MKRITLLFLILLAVNFSFAQKSNVTQASSQLGMGKLDVAKQAIDEDLAANDEKTVSWYKAWFVRGQVYQAISESLLPMYKALDADAVSKAYDAYMKALSFCGTEKKPEKAQAEVYEKLFNPEKPLDPSMKTALINKGATEFGEKKYANAVASFEQAMELNNMVGATNVIDSAVIYYTALACDNAGNEADETAKKAFYDKALTLYSKAIEIKYEAEKAYVFKAGILEKLGDKKATLDCINQGLASYPSSGLIIGSMINYYINNNELDKALTSVSDAIAKGNDDPSYLYTKGALLDKKAEGFANRAKELNEIVKESKKELFRERNNPAKLKEVQARYDKEVAEYNTSDKQSEAVYSEAIAMYDQTLAKKADYFDAAYNKGAIFYNHAVKHELAANGISPTDDQDGSKFKTSMDKANEYFKKSLDAFLAADKIKPKDEYTLKNLKNIYYKLKMTDKYNEMKQLIDNL